MSVFLGNLEAFFKKHPNLLTKEQKQVALVEAKEIAVSNGGLITSVRIKEIFTDPVAAEMFFHEIKSPEHSRIFSEENFGKNH